MDVFAIPTFMFLWAMNYEPAFYLTVSEPADTFKYAEVQKKNQWLPEHISNFSKK